MKDARSPMKDAMNNLARRHPDSPSVIPSEVEGSPSRARHEIPRLRCALKYALRPTSGLRFARNDGRSGILPSHSGDATRAEPAPRRSGQAIVELVVALVVILVLVAGTIQIGLLGLSRTELMVKARREAGSLGLQPIPAVSMPEYIGDRTVGRDGAAYSKDDGIAAGVERDFVDRIVDYAQPSRLQTYAPGNALSALSQSVAPRQMFGLTHARYTRSVPLLPVVQTLLYASDSAEVEGSAWMTWTQGIY